MQHALLKVLRKLKLTLFYERKFFCQLSQYVYLVDLDAENYRGCVIFHASSKTHCVLKVSIFVQQNQTYTSFWC